MSLRGYWRTLSERDRLQSRDDDHQANDQGEDRPADEEIGEIFHRSRIHRDEGVNGAESGAGRRFYFGDSPFAHSDFEIPSRIVRLGVELRFRRELVVDHDVHPVAQFEGAGADNLLVLLSSLP